ncbi:peptidase C45 [Mesorhizobium sp. M1C.F.Ca.ET.193.01.1.1]|uniref:C45 family autoproteolytic acyltransferase/hydolase n=1 Tax=unclassified Mesorhizobium TaxID=325217 RepID=UPI000FD52010|nr:MULTISPECIES: C45 family peptidase [unclassified Mesorhizobium]TGS96512.1 peptidase C45 [bacterium M00.F.Ca.ET.177.01.1.1]TGQ52242.1 peptidase C45 [Mesorhizobium sp. M1C.F.Ca.ET.210.01.1.1]TGQ68881.1 peptidase C45 [Mesorhizobium sp. M1C.F.Ca.ET.212.01.1.1]TGR04232.1 peptidase C45 [Mesorhizobium sp. M1C.F.Ca.ET.204.01.1.1]TGR24897.1 peptidase C45 [Mesorhizobium sp. M1C.F.Ca.ET.196.01.1.1]
MSHNADHRLSFINVAGSPYDVGAALGRFGQAALHEHFRTSAAWRELTARRADPRIGMMATIVRERFPRYWAELQGLAEGLELPFDDVFLWNCRGDIWAMAPDGCTTVQLPGSLHIIGHNEDGDPDFAGRCALAYVDSAGGTPFTAFVYPGSMPGHTFAATSKGLVQTVNNIRPLAGGAGTPRMVLARAVLDAPDLDAALALLRSAPRAGAFHLTLAQAGDERLLSVEFTAQALSVDRVEAARVHSNHLIHADTGRMSQVVTGSSGVRQRRGELLLGQTVQSDPQGRVLGILWDAEDPELPIYRTDPADSDIENTLASAVFCIGADKVEWAVYDGAFEAARFDMRDGLVPLGG